MVAFTNYKVERDTVTGFIESMTTHYPGVKVIIGIPDTVSVSAPYNVHVQRYDRYM